MTAATETGRGAGMNASTSSRVTTRGMTAMANVFQRPKNATYNVHQLQRVLSPSNVAKILKQHADLSQIILLSELVKKLGSASITSSHVWISAGTATSNVEMSVARSLNSEFAMGSVLKTMFSAMKCVLKEERPVDKNTVCLQTHRILTPQQTTRSAMECARR